MSRFYIATSLKRWKEQNLVRDTLLAMGHEITYDWSAHGSVKSTTKERLNSVARNEMNGVLRADMVLVLLPGGFGTHVELGAAIAGGKPVILHCEEEEIFLACEKTCAFYHHDNVTQVCTPMEQFPSWLSRHLDCAAVSR